MNRSPGRRWLLFLSGVTLLFAMWTIVLPWIGDRPLVHRRIKFLESQAVDPSALYYTDLEAMHRLEKIVADKRHLHPRAFWIPATRE